MDELTLTQISIDDRVAAARARLAAPVAEPISSMKALSAAALAAFSALTLAAAVILGPGFEGKAAPAPAASASVAVQR